MACVAVLFVALAALIFGLIGRFGDLPAAVWVYSANMALAAMASLATSFVAERDSGQKPDRTGRIDLVVLIASAILSVIVSFFEPRYAMFAYFLNFAKPLVARLLPEHWRERLQ